MMASRAVAETAPRAVEPGRTHRRVQASLQVSSPGDASEREADSTARKIMTMPAPAIGVRERVAHLAARAPAPARARDDQTSPELAAAIRGQLGGGRPLPPETRRFMEPRFKANLSAVRIHTDAKAENLTSRLGARAFAYGRDIFFNAGQFQPDTPAGMELIAHELTHTIQQREVVQRDVPITQKSAPKVQRGLISRALDWVAEKANNIPGFRLFTIVIGTNPINMSSVDRSGANILRALIEFIPGGGLVVQALENHGVFQRGGKFIEDQFRSLGMVGSAFRTALMDFLDSLGITDIARPGKVIDRAIAIFTSPVKQLIAFGKGLVGGIAEIVKDVILKPLGRWAASNIPKWDLLVAVFGKNPISDEGESPASAIIGAFMELIGQKEIWDNIKKGNAVAKAWDWFQGAMKGALSLVTSIPGRVMGVIRSLTIFDIVTIAGAFSKIFSAFSSFVGSFISWAGGTVLQLLEIILSVVAPTMVPYLKKAGAAFNTIIKAPGTFINTLVKAGKQGFNSFAKNIVRHLTKGLLDWLLGSLAGANLYIPKSFAIQELLKFGLSVVGLTWTNVRAKLVKATNETVVKTLEAGFGLVKTLVTEGPAAAWKELLGHLTNLKGMVQDAIMDYVKQKVIEVAITRLVMMLNPAGAFIAAIQAIYSTITFVVAKLRQIGALVAAFIDGIAAMAAGQIAPAATRVESVLANGLSLAINFLANYANLGNVSKKVIEIVNKIRAPVDKALDKVIDWVVGQAKKLGKMIVGKDGTPRSKIPDAKGESDFSRNVKAEVRRALAGKSIQDRKQGEALVSSVFKSHQAQGLRGLKPVFADGNVRILASASAAEEVANLPVTATGARAALDYFYRFQYLTGRTVLQIHYDGGKSYGPLIENDASASGPNHAEDIFARDHLPGLARQIADDQKAGKLNTKTGPVKLTMSLNRLPCPHCSPLLVRLAGQYPHLSFGVLAASVSNAQTLQKAVPTDSEAHIAFIQQMIEANIDVQPLAIFEAVWAKLLQVAKAAQAGKVRLRNGSLADEVASARQLLGSSLAETQRVKDLITEAKRRAALKKLPQQGNVA